MGVEAVAKALGISRATAYRRVADGSIPSIRVGHRVRLIPETVAAAVAAGKAAPK